MNFMEWTASLKQANKKMKVTKELLDTIYWKGLTVFPNEHLVVLECANNHQSLNFIKLLLANDFAFKIGEEENGSPAYIITFKTPVLVKYLIAEDNKLFEHFENKKVRWLTTGFRTEIGEIACHQEDKIEMRGMQFFELN